MGMRVLLTTTAGLGHIHPMVPLAKALTARGHDVVWAVPPHGVHDVEKTGLAAVAAGSKAPILPGAVLERFPELTELPPVQRPDVMFGKLFGVLHAPAALDDLVGIVQERPPDLVVSDAAELAGPIVAAELGVPGVIKGFGPVLPERRLRLASEEVAPLWRSRGLEPRPYAGCYEHLYIDIYPPELQAEPSPHITRRQLMRPVTDDGQTDPTTPLPLPSDRPDAPLVYVTMGTVFNDPAPLRTILEGLADLDVRVLATVGPAAEPSTLGPQPAHVRVEQYVPQTAVLPQCTVVVSHGGSGTTLSTAALGIPQLSVPQGADQFLNASAVAAAGAGLALMPGEGSADAVREAVGRLLTDATFATQAARVAASIDAMPSPADVAEVLEGLT